MDEVFIRTWTLPEWLAKKYFREKDFYSIDELIAIIEDLDSEVERLKEQYNDLQDEIKDNYKFIDQKEAVGYNENW